MKINCLSCGHKVELDEAYNDYAGEIKCYVCDGLLEIRTEDGKVRAVRRVRCATPVPEQEPCAT